MMVDCPVSIALLQATRDSLFSSSSMRVLKRSVSSGDLTLAASNSESDSKQVDPDSPMRNGRDLGISPLLYVE